jgi:Coenzyme PQQ synthesis protein D (PqqD)
MTAQLDARTRVTVSPSVYSRPFGSELVLLDFSRGEYFGLDEAGAEIWRGLSAGDDLATIAARISARFEVTREDALTDIIDLVTEMSTQQLLKVR